jgi:hypothetical protein
LLLKARNGALSALGIGQSRQRDSHICKNSFIKPPAASPEARRLKIAAKNRFCWPAAYAFAMEAARVGFHRDAVQVKSIFRGRLHASLATSSRAS